MAKRKFTPIDKSKLTEALKEKGETVKSASRKIGLGDNTLTAQLWDQGGLVEPYILLIESVIGIPRARFIETKKSEPQIPDSEQINISRDTDKLLRDLIDGQTVMINMIQRLEDTIFNAVDKAWKQ